MTSGDHSPIFGTSQGPNSIPETTSSLTIDLVFGALDGAHAKTPKSCAVIQQQTFEGRTEAEDQLHSYEESQFSRPRLAKACEGPTIRGLLGSSGIIS